MIDETGIVTASARAARAPAGHVVVINPRTGDWNYIREEEISRPGFIPPVSSIGGGSLWYDWAGPLFKVASLLAMFFIVFVLGLYFGGRTTCVQRLSVLDCPAGAPCTWTWHQ
jgi:hypothetical protein